jgi:2-dehydro-3-deoxyphosphogluconate aldolase/(4S)-4-hydroxy-2-oxoglutarate aldolase
MTRKATLAQILEERVVGIVRLDAASDFPRIAEALVDGGLRCLEITMTTPGVLEGIQAIAEAVPEALVGAGTVLDSEMARQAVEAGARFLVTPTSTLDVIETARHEDVVVIPGALTPTEIHRVWEAGADLVKVFPASLGGPSYIRSIKGPLPEIRLAATGGVSLENAADFLREGASAVCVGGWLVPKDAVRDAQYAVLTRRAAQIMDAVRRAS